MCIRDSTNVVLISLIPILFQYIQTLISSSAQAAGSTVAEIGAAKFAEFSVPIEGIQYLGNGAFLSSLLIAGLLAYVIDKKYFLASAFGGVLALCSFVGMIHAETVALFPPGGVTFGIIYLIVAAWLAVKGFLFRDTGKQITPHTNLS